MNEPGVVPQIIIHFSANWISRGSVTVLKDLPNDPIEDGATLAFGLLKFA